MLDLTSITRPTTTRPMTMLDALWRGAVFGKSAIDALKPRLVQVVGGKDEEGPIV